MSFRVNPTRQRAGRRRYRLGSLIPVVLAAFACAPANPPPDAAIVVTDRAGRTVRLAGPAARVASLVPSATDWVVALGAGDRLVVRTDHDQGPELRHVPSVGGGLTPSVEWVVARRPDLVIAWADGANRATVARLEDLGIPVYVATAETVDEGLGIALDLGRLLGLEHRATRVASRVAEDLEAQRDRAPAGAGPSVLFLIGLDPVTGAGAGTFVHQLVTIAGGRNALAGLARGWPPLSLEEVVHREPDVILVGTTAADPLAVLRDRPGWRALAAVRAGRVHAVHPDLVGRWGPQMSAAADTLARLIHAAPRP